ncbi:MAG TPA: site-2 protease family protein [Candidatus Deferrimicrobiaceae bacterium]|nr:site-2 protease family protein [Candidatus Deferrimicrobiaceae bacterium]
MTTNGVLFALTFLTTLVAGAFLAGGNPLKNPIDLLLGFMFSLPLLSILGVHELGHYTAARRHDVEVTPPYFIPAPSFIGTFGAFIKIKSPVPHRNALMDIGAAGPIAGAIVAVPVLLVGLKLSVVRQTAGAETGIPLGESILFRAATYAVLGSVPEGHDVVLHPVAFAGWIGLLVTALNLLPSGQLDGGHIAYALFGGAYTRVARTIPFLLLPLGLLWGGWFIWAVLLMILGTNHPPPLFDEIPLTPGRRRLGIAAALLFVLCFTPNPVPV